MSDLFRVSARAAVDLLRTGEVSPLDMVDAAAARIEATDGALNALPTPCIERARDHARRIMASGPAQAGNGPWLAGLPLVKIATLAIFTGGAGHAGHAGPARIRAC